MAYLAPSEFAVKMVDAGEAKIFMSTRDTVIRRERQLRSRLRTLGVYDPRSGKHEIRNSKFKTNREWKGLRFWISNLDFWSDSRRKAGVGGVR